MGFLGQVVVSWRLTLLGISGAGTGSPRDWHGVLGYGQGGGSPRGWAGTEVRDRSVPLDHGTLGHPLGEANARCGILQITAAAWRYCICHENTICPYQAVRPQQPIFPPLLRKAATLDYLSDQRPHSAGTRTAYPFCLCSDGSVQLSLYDHHQKCNHSTSSCLISIPITQL